MTATVQVGEKNGTAGTFTDKSSGTIRFKNADNATVDANNTMVVPTSGYDRSYKKWTRLKVTVAPATNITNLKFYTDGTSGFGTGIATYAKAVTTYATPAEPTADTGFTDAFTYTSGSALSLGTASYTGTGEKGDHCVLYLRVATSASQGTLTAETGTWSYDET